MKTVYDLRTVPDKWPKQHRSFNAQLIPKKLQELALSGTYYDDRLIN